MVKAYRRHVLICGGSDCAERHGEELLAALKRMVRDRGLGGVKVSKSGCLGECEQGPHLVVYPEGVWYSGIGLEDLPAILEEHLVGERTVPALASFVLALGKQVCRTSCQ